MLKHVQHWMTAVALSIEGVKRPMKTAGLAVDAKGGGEVRKGARIPNVHQEVVSRASAGLAASGGENETLPGTLNGLERETGSSGRTTGLFALAKPPNPAAKREDR
ncbi:hypothetical protein KM043_010616 [Ampulex compressa]|nr:hypothetical protein KM043_010616 [Ampulex compressa]